MGANSDFNIIERQTFTLTANLVDNSVVFPIRFGYQTIVFRDYTANDSSNVLHLQMAVSPSNLSSTSEWHIVGEFDASTNTAITDRPFTFDLTGTGYGVPLEFPSYGYQGRIQVNETVNAGTAGSVTIQVALLAN